MNHKMLGYALLTIVLSLVASSFLVSVKANNPYDIDDDGDVDIDDIAMVAQAFGSYVGHPRYDPDCDVFPFGLPDGKVDIRDVIAVAMYFGS